jgi:asparagine synthase (glutamine-hydrolysing)
MSGIAGIFRFDGASVDMDTMERMLAPLKQRGPHGQAVYLEERIGLGLTLLDLSPQTKWGVVSSSRPSIHLPVIFDGRLDNRSDLIVKLDLQKNTPNDVELIFAAYEKWGEACPTYLLGDFAFAIWDRKKNRLFCARDHFGVKPFYYHYSNQYFLFASSPYAILAAYKDLCEVNEARIADFLVGFEGYDETVTFYKRIFRLPRRQSMTVDAQGIKTAAYWDLQPTLNKYRNENEYIEAFHEIFSEAVQNRLGTSANTFVPLSGGLDSTSIAAVTREIFSQQGSSVRTLSAVSADENDSETGRIRSILAQGGMSGMILSGEYVQLQIDKLISDLAGMDEPFDTLENSWRPLYGKAQKEGIHISLDGIDSDMMFSGSNYLTVLWRSGQYQAFLKETLFIGGLIGNYYHPLKWFLKSLRSELTPDWLKALRRTFSNRTVISRMNGHSIITRDLAYSVDLIGRHKQFSSYDVRAASTSLIESHKQSIFHPHLQAALERYDRIAASYSIESRHPFLDVRLVEFCLALPWQLRTHRGWNKVLLRKAMKTLLPEQVVQGKEKKHPAWGFSMQILSTKKTYFQEVINDERINLKKYLNINKLDVVWNRFYLYGDETSAAQIWEAVGLAFWLRRQRSISS